MVQLTIIGNLCKDAEIKQIGSNSYLSMRVAAQVTKENTLFVDVMKRNADALAQYCTKGKKIYAQGGINLAAYIGNGEPAASITLWADRIELLSSNQNTEGAAAF